MSALAFLENYQRIRQQYYSPTRGLVRTIEDAPRIKARLVYHFPIGPLPSVNFRAHLISEGMADAHTILDRSVIVRLPRSRGHEILREVCGKHGLKIESVISPRRSAKLVRARQEIMYRMCEETDWSLPQIGRLLGDRDHSTVIHGYRRFKELLDSGQVTL